MNIKEFLNFKQGSIIYVDNRMQKGYSFVLDEPVGKNFEHGFKPFYTPKEMLSLGVFEGHYCTDCKGEYPPSWFVGAKISSSPDINCNFFKVKSRQSLSE